ncbi:MAG: MoaD/ThiS family protein [Actinomycetota bacterium]
MPRLRYWAAVREAAGVAEEALPGETLADLLAAARRRHADRPRFGPVLGACAFLVDGDPVGTRPRAGVPVPPDAVVDALPPFAGG